MNPNCISENLLFCTARIVTKNGVGTGFFFSFPTDEVGQEIPILITNKHVVDDDPYMPVTLELHTHVEGVAQQESVKFEYTGKWEMHPNQDLCFQYVAPMINFFEIHYKKNVFFRCFSVDSILSDESLLNLRAIEEVIMIGYPVGLYDVYNNFPLFRSGITSSHPGINFENQSVGVVDIASFRGSSGSPICILDEGQYTLKNGTTKIGSSRLILLGVLNKIGVLNSNNEIQMINVPGSLVPGVKTETMLNIGYYIKAKEIQYFKSMIMDVYMKQKQ